MGTERRERGLRPGLDRGGGEDLAGFRPEVLDGDLDSAPEPGSAACLGAALGLAVQRGDAVGQAGDQRRGQRAAVGDAVQLRLGIEAPHDDHPIDRLPIAAKCEPAAIGAYHGLDAEIQVWGEAPVDGEFRFAGGAAAVGGRVVEVAVADRALQLERAIAGEEHQRDVRLGLIDPVGAKGRRVGQQADHLVLAGHVLPPRCNRCSRSAVASSAG